jgi:hypothetical protein
LPELVAAREGFFVGCDDADALLQEKRVRVCDVLVACVVDEDDFCGGFGEVVGELGEGEGWRCGGLELGEGGLPVAEGFVVRVVKSFLGG